VTAKSYPVAPEPPTPRAPQCAKAPRFFGRVDWLTFLLVFGAVGLGYFLTLAPEVTLEDSGELATASFYAGIPHPPGYPVWTVYTWLWTVLLPFKNIAWRVSMGEAAAGALAASLLALLVSRGSSLLIEGLDELKTLPNRSRTGICMVSGFVAGLLLGFNGFMWSQSVIVEVYSFGVLSLMVVLACLMRWIYAPQKHRYLYFALFFFGICFTNHQTLIVAAMGIEAAIAAADFRLGRNLFLGNTILYFSGWALASAQVLSALPANPAVYVIFHVVGLCSVAAYAGFAFLTRETLIELSHDGLYAAFWILLALIPALGAVGLILALGALVSFLRLSWKDRRVGREWLVVLLCGFCWIAGASFYFYMPLAGMTNPPMEWGYPRTVEGFIHVFTRGQYGKTNPTDLFHDPLTFGLQLMALVHGIIEEFNWVGAALALAPCFFFRSMRRSERAWFVGIAAIYACLGVLLLILLNPPPDRSAQQLHRVFFTASHTLIAMLVGYGLTLSAAFMAAQYQRFRPWGILGGLAAIGLAGVSFANLVQDGYFGEGFAPSLSQILSLVANAFRNQYQYALPIYAGLGLIGSALAFLAAVVFCRQRAPVAATLVLFALLPAYSVLSHWSDNEQRNHWFGYWYGHDMFSPPFKAPDGRPLYPEMPRNAILFGGTDAGRFCATYMIFCESFTPRWCQTSEDQKFDRRDVYIITQNSLADPPYLNYLRAQYNRSRQIDPPFFQEFSRLLLRDQASQTNPLARVVWPLDRLFTQLGARIEKRRRTASSQFKPEDFLDLPAFAARLRPGAQSNSLAQFLSDHLSPETRQLLRDPKTDDRRLGRCLATDLNRLLEQESTPDISAPSQPSSSSFVPPLYTPERFQTVAMGDYLADFLRQNPSGYARLRLNRLLLEAAFPAEIAKTPGGVYPDREIYIPTPEDAGHCYEDYRLDAQRRKAQNRLEPGEIVNFADGKMVLDGQVSIMAINSLIAKVIFDRNPRSEFFVEESLPVKWMYPHLTPYGTIMKVNRQPVAEMDDDTIRRDHEFWSQYSDRLVGNWITYETSVKDLVAWVDRLYMRHDYTGFTGDRKYVRDDQAQKTFSKLRTALGGLYAYRMRTTNAQERQRMVKEADFAFRQAVAFCPYNLEAVAHYVELLANLHRFDDALLIARTCLKLDPNNGQIVTILNNLETWKRQEAERDPNTRRLSEMELAVRNKPTDFQAAFDLAAFLLAIEQTNRALGTLDGIVNNPQVNAPALQVAVQAFGQLGDSPRIQNALEKSIRLSPELPEAWCNLAAFKAVTGRTNEALADLRRAVQFNAKRLRHDPKAPDLLQNLPKDPRLESLRQHPEFLRLLTPGN